MLWCVKNVSNIHVIGRGVLHCNLSFVKEWFNRPLGIRHMLTRIASPLIQKNFSLGSYLLGHV